MYSTCNEGKSVAAERLLELQKIRFTNIRFTNICYETCLL